MQPLNFFASWLANDLRSNTVSNKKQTLSAAVIESHHAIKDQILRDIHIGRDDKLRAFLWDKTHTHIYGSVVKENNGIFISWILFDDGQKELAQYGDLEAIVIAIAKRWW